MVMHDATFQKIRRLLSLGKTQSMLYSLFTAIATKRCTAVVTHALHGIQTCSYVFLAEKRKTKKTTTDPRRPVAVVPGRMCSAFIRVLRRVTPPSIDRCVLPSYSRTDNVNNLSTDNGRKRRANSKHYSLVSYSFLHFFTRISFSGRVVLSRGQTRGGGSHICRRMREMITTTRRALRRRQQQQRRGDGDGDREEHVCRRT